MTDASWIERAILIVLLAASAGLFWWRFHKVPDAIRHARPTPDFEVKRSSDRASATSSGK